MSQHSYSLRAVCGVNIAGATKDRISLTMTQYNDELCAVKKLIVYNCIRGSDNF